MATTVLIIRALPWGFDSRTLLWAEIYSNTKNNIAWGCWGSRESKHIESNIINRRPTSGFLAFVIGYLSFISMSFFYAFARLKRNDIVVCIDLESVLLVIVAARLRGAKVHFDIADPFYLAKPVPFKFLWRWLEGKYIQWSDIATAPHDSRFDLYFIGKPSHALAVENVPNIRTATLDRCFLKRNKGRRCIRFGYFGRLESHRGLENLLTLVETHQDAYLHIGGNGPLEPIIREATKCCKRISFFGPFNPSELIHLTTNIDIYYAIYEPTKELHRFAIPNKYYEHLALGIPILISKNIHHATDVEKNGTGWAIDPGLDNLVTWFKHAINDMLGLERASNRSKLIWNEKYSDWMAKHRSIFQSHFKT